MEGDYLELSQFPYNSNQSPYNPYPIPLETTRFLTCLQLLEGEKNKDETLQCKLMQ